MNPAAAHLGDVIQLGSGPSVRLSSHGGVRIALFLLLIWALNLLDLLFTRLAYMTRGFTELNPVASHLGGTGQFLLKLGALSVVTIVFVCLRRRRSVQWGCYLLLGVYGLLAIIWLTVFPFLLSPCYVERLWSGL